MGSLTAAVLGDLQNIFNLVVDFLFLVLTLKLVEMIRLVLRFFLGGFVQPPTIFSWTELVS